MKNRVTEYHVIITVDGEEVQYGSCPHCTKGCFNSNGQCTRESCSHFMKTPDNFVEVLEVKYKRMNTYFVLAPHHDKDCITTYEESPCCAMKFNSDGSCSLCKKTLKGMISVVTKVYIEE